MRLLRAPMPARKALCKEPRRTVSGLCPSHKKHLPSSPSHKQVRWKPPNGSQKLRVSHFKVLLMGSQCGYRASQAKPQLWACGSLAQQCVHGGQPHPLGARTTSQDRFLASGEKATISVASSGPAGQNGLGTTLCLRLTRLPHTSETGAVPGVPWGTSLLHHTWTTKVPQLWKGEGLRLIAKPHSWPHELQPVVTCAEKSKALLETRLASRRSLQLAVPAVRGSTSQCAGNRPLDRGSLVREGSGLVVCNWRRPEQSDDG